MHSSGVGIYVSTDIYIQDGVMPEGCGRLVRNLKKAIPDFENTHTIQQGELNQFPF
jgi:hypothetical protein